MFIFLRCPVVSYLHIFISLVTFCLSVYTDFPNDDFCPSECSVRTPFLPSLNLTQEHLLPGASFGPEINPKVCVL